MVAPGDYHPRAKMELPTISIITPSLNQAQFLEETLRSVLDQRYPRLEYIVIDGGSTDGTVDIIRRYEPWLAYWVSEPDGGQAHALNKGLEKITGDVVAFINSDDLYLPGAFGAVAEYFRHHADCEWLCGDTIKFGDGHRTELIRAVVPESAGHWLSWCSNAPQPGMFWKRDLLATGFQENWRYCFDHELCARLLLAGHECRHVPLPLAGYRLHPSSKTVAEGGEFGREFDEIAEMYKERLSGSGRRLTVATLLLRQSGAASEAGDMRKSFAHLLRALLAHPESVSRRPFWGYLRRALNCCLRKIYEPGVGTRL